MCAGRTSVAGRRERVRFLRHRAVGTRARSRCAAHSALRPEGPAVPGARLGRDAPRLLLRSLRGLALLRVAPPLVVPPGGLDVEFSDVNFGYGGGKAAGRADVLDGLSFKVPAGNSLALVGASGSGKSTVLRLLYRLYDVQSGTVKLGGQDTREVQARSLRREIGVVPQDTVLFNDTIYYNIAYGKEGGEGTNFYHRAQWLDGTLKLESTYKDYKWLTKVRARFPAFDFHEPRLCDSAVDGIGDDETQLSLHWSSFHRSLTNGAE